MYTCENNAKARTSHADAIGDNTCRFVNVEDFIDPDTLSEMSKVKASKTTKRFEKWLQLVKKGKHPPNAFCCKHLKKCLPALFSEISKSFCTVYAKSDPLCVCKYIYILPGVANLGVQFEKVS